MVNTSNGDVHWLHQDTTMFQVQEKSLQLQRQNTTPTDVSGTGNSSSSNAGEWKFELRVRYLPTDLTDLYDRDKVTFSCYYDQVQSDYLKKNFESGLDLDTAVAL